MATLTFKTWSGHATVVSMPEGGELMDAIAAHGVPVALSCRSGVCGRCLVQVASGAEHLQRPGELELAVLGATGRVGARLACQAKVSAAAGEVVLFVARRGAELPPGPADEVGRR